MKLLLTKDAMIEHMKQKGIKFNIMSEEQAKMFLTDNNYYMKLASYRTNYEKNCTTGKYKNLDFAYLRELSTIDMRLRYLIIEMSLDMEHAIKVILLNEIESNDREDGYNIIRKFVGNEHNSYILKKIHNHKSSEYSRNLVDKYYPYFPAWVFVELISFGDLTYLCDFYKKEYGTEIIKNKFMNEVRDLRNAAAHSNCLINRVAAGDARIDNKKYKAQFHTKAKMLSFEEVEELTGHTVGGVCPFGVKESVKVYLDESLRRFEKVYPACGSSNSAVELTLPELERASGCESWIDVCK